MIRHISSIAEIVDNIDAAVHFYREVLGIKVQHEPGEGYGTVEVPGILHFGLWTRAAAAENIFGDANAIDRVPAGFLLEFEVDNVEVESGAIRSKGWSLIQETRKESWGQTTSRFLLPSGMLGGFSETPWARTLAQNLQAQPASEQKEGTAETQS